MNALSRQAWGSRWGSRQGAIPRTSSASAVLSPGLSPQIPAHHYLELRPGSEPLPRPNGTEPVRLTSRDLAVLTALHQYRYLDREQVERLFFQGRRRAQLRLLELRSRGLITGWRCLLQPGLYPMPSVYVLAAAGARVLAHSRHADPRPLVARARSAHERAFHVLHDLEANGFFIRVAAASRDRAAEGLYHWVGEIACREGRAAEGAPASDGWGRYLLPDRELIFDLEWDRGTEHSRRLRQKASSYIEYFRGRRGAHRHHVLFVVPSAAREGEVKDTMASLTDHRECCSFWTTSFERLYAKGPLGQIWQPISDPDGRVAFGDMPSLPTRRRRVEDCIGKDRWWERRPGGGEGA